MVFEITEQNFEKEVLNSKDLRRFQMSISTR